MTMKTNLLEPYEISDAAYKDAKRKGLVPEKTKVIFRVSRDKTREVCALFPALAGTNDPWTCTCYASIGQHGSANVDYVYATRLAKPHEYADLAQELERIGYKLDIRKRFTSADLEARKEQVKV